MKSYYDAALVAKAAAIRLAVFDVDGVLTDGCLVLGPDGEEFKNFHVRDGQGLVMLRDNGVELGIITGRRSAVVEARMAELGIRHVFQGQKNKLEALNELMDELSVDPIEVCYVGDDLPDIPIMQRVGLAVMVADAHWQLRDVVHWRTTSGGGRGAAREVCDLIMYSKGLLELHEERRGDDHSPRSSR